MIIFHLIRPLTVAERPPKPGDVIRRGRRRLEVHSWGWVQGVLVGCAFDGYGETFSIGPKPEGGWSEMGNIGQWEWWPPYYYESRADGGEITQPLDAGAWV